MDSGVNFYLYTGGGDDCKAVLEDIKALEAAGGSLTFFVVVGSLELGSSRTLSTQDQRITRLHKGPSRTRSFGTTESLQNVPLRTQLLVQRVRGSALLFSCSLLCIQVVRTKKFASLPLAVPKAT